MYIPLKLLLSVVLVTGGCWWMWRLTNPDPKALRTCLTPEEEQAAEARVAWAKTELAQFSLAAGLSKLPSFGIANQGAYYSPMRHRISVSAAFLARLSDDDLRLIMAHEVGHAVRGWPAILRERQAEEIAADRIALQITGCTPKQWMTAMQASLLAEATPIETSLLTRRAEALHIQLAALQSAHDTTK